MKKTFRRNQIVVSALAIMIAVAGYLTYAGKDGTGTSSSLYQTNEVADSGDTYVAKASQAAAGKTAEETQSVDSPSQAEQTTQASVDDSTQPAETSAAGEAAASSDAAVSDIESLDQDVADVLENPGEAVLTSGLTVADFMAQQKLNREQTRGMNKEALLNIINSDTISEAEKQNAVDNMVQLTEIAEKENAAESLLKTKGFEECIVSIANGQADVVICRQSLTDAEKAQIEDIIKRKTDIGVENIVITLMETN